MAIDFKAGQKKEDKAHTIWHYHDAIIIYYGHMVLGVRTRPVWTTSRSVTGERVWSARKRKLNFKKPFDVRNHENIL